MVRLLQIGFLLLSLCSLRGFIHASPSDDYDLMINDFFNFRLRESPEYASKYALPVYQDQIEQWSEAAFSRRVAEARSFQTRVDQLLKVNNDSKQRLSLRILKDILITFIDGSAYQRQVASLNDELISWPKVMGWNAVNDMTKLQNWFRRMQKIPQQFSDSRTLLQTALQGGYTVPRVVADFYKNQLYDQYGGKNSTTLFAFKPWTDLNVSNTNRSFYEDGVAASAAIILAYGSFQDFYVNTYIPACRNSTGLSALPGGADAYRAALKWHTDKDSTPEKVFQLGLQEVDRVSSAMNDILHKLGYHGTLREYVSAALLNPDETYSSAAETKAAYEDLINNTIKPSLLQQFRWFPSRVGLVVMTSKGAGLGFYSDPSADGTRPGQFLFDWAPENKILKINMLPLAIHETMPGHHLQVSYGIEHDMERFRRLTEYRHYATVPFNWPFYTAYNEGWGLYAESLGENLGLYKTDKDRLGKYSLEILRACRLVVDVGLHYYNWTVEKASEHLRNYTTLGEPQIASEVLRYIRWPGQACAYKIGELKILGLRRKAETHLGSKFDAKSFHDLVLSVGPSPLDILEDVVTEWIDDKPTSSAPKIPSVSFTLAIMLLVWSVQ